MNYKGILTEETAEQFKKEGATTAIITLYDKTLYKVIREMEVQLEEAERHFVIGAKNEKAAALMNTYFHGEVINGERWFPFHSPSSVGVEKLLEGVAKCVGVEPSHLKWLYINDR